jgi:S-adenosyl methyltransferase
VHSGSHVSEVERNLRSPNTARIYSYLIGGSGSFWPDRAEADKLLAICPQLRDAARDNRDFITRAVTWAAGQGITQFADLGAGVPMPRGTGGTDGLPEIHEIARAVYPAARVTYVDNDPIVLLHSRASRARVRRGEGYEPAEGVAVVEADLREPGKVLAAPGLLKVIDLAEPVCVILGLVMGLMPAGQAREAVAGYADRAAPGSMFVISCIRVDDAGLRDRLARAFTAAEVWNHTRGQVAGFLGGLELIDPGLVVARTWRGGMPDPHLSPGAPAYVLGAVARKQVRYDRKA